MSAMFLDMIRIQIAIFAVVLALICCAEVRSMYLDRQTDEDTTFTSPDRTTASALRSVRSRRPSATLSWVRRPAAASLAMLASFFML